MPNTSPERGDVVTQNPDYFLSGGTRETIPRRVPSVNTVAVAATGVMAAYAVTLYQGDLISGICFRTGGTAATTPTNWWVALYDGSVSAPALMSQSADQLTAPVAATTLFGPSLLVPQRIVLTGTYYLAMSFTAAVVPTMTGIVTASTVMTGPIANVPAMRQLVFSSGSALAGVAPATIAGTTSLVGIPWMVAF